MIPGLALTFYGDDFTGSTDCMEVLTWAGLPAVMFLEAPDEQKLALFPEARAIGIAGVSRSQSPAWMSEQLPAIFERLRAMGAPLCHYKVCSTFDSSPTTGSIGRALELGQDVFGCAWVPMVVGAPSLGRYQAFGNLFATVNGETLRLDRHPTMTRHPVTPMDEADLRRHLALQTSRRIALMDLVALREKDPAAQFARLLEERPQAVLFDILDEDTLRVAGGLIWEACRKSPLFAVGSSGLEYALAAYWSASGALPETAANLSAGAVDRVLVVSGSCSPDTEATIRWSLAHGFEGVRLDVAALASGSGQAREAAVKAAESAVAQGRSVIVYSALGPNDPALLPADAATQHRLGQDLGLILQTLLDRTGIRRAIVCGGDSSGYATRQLGVFALRAMARLVPGAPLCRASADGAMDGLEIVLKGGQRGGLDFFEQVRLGSAERCLV